MNKKVLSLLLGCFTSLCLVTFAQALPIIAYEVPVNTAGNQSWTGSLGMLFDVEEEINVLALGAFDDDSDSLARQITVQLYDRNNTATPLAQQVFATGNTGTLIGGSRFIDLAAPLYLPTGFQGAIVAFGYGPGEQNGNLGVANPGSWTTNDGGGLITFLGTSLYAPMGDTGYPTLVDGGPNNRYAAGTFSYAPVPEPATMLLLGAGLAGLAGIARRRKQHNR